MEHRYYEKEYLITLAYLLIYLPGPGYGDRCPLPLVPLQVEPVMTMCIVTFSLKSFLILFCGFIRNQIKETCPITGELHNANYY